MITVFAGGVGAARLLQGLVQVVDEESLQVIVNTGDDTIVHGLHVSPDLDTITYTLGGVSNTETGWGLSGETWNTLQSLDRFGVDTWFSLGDRDIATHLFRTSQLASGRPLSDVTADITKAFGLRLSLLPMSNDAVRTRLMLASGVEVEFQEYFVKLRHSVAVSSVSFCGASQARPGPGVLEAIAHSDRIVIAPSNPIVSIGPILAVPGIADALRARRDDVVAVSPIVAGAALKGPADRLLAELGHESSALGVLDVLHPYIGSYVIDQQDADLVSTIADRGVSCVVTDTIMKTPDISAELARCVLASGPST